MAPESSKDTVSLPSHRSGSAAPKWWETRRAANRARVGSHLAVEVDRDENS